MLLVPFVVLLVTPALLGILSVYPWPSRRKPLLNIVPVACCQWILVATLDALPQGGFDHHGNTIWGYLLITIGPFIFVIGTMIAFPRLLSQSGKIRPQYLSGLIPLSYWAGLVFFISLSLYLKLAVM